ncbi:MAG: hypothetical protein HC904_12875 [Blastochloris sp.]|nr:hypothetical protein [Blastochloris sp.]
MDGVEHGWTCIGCDNHRARNLLESRVAWLPRYLPRQKINTWFIPLSRQQATSVPSPDRDQQLGLQPAAWRQVAVTAGRGWSYRVGRLLHRMGFPGIAPPHQPIRVAYYHPQPDHNPTQIRALTNEAAGYDGLVIVLPGESNQAKRMEKYLPRMAWNWQSTLYSVTWKAGKLPEIPNWKGIWL